MGLFRALGAESGFGPCPGLAASSDKLPCHAQILNPQSRQKPFRRSHEKKLAGCRPDCRVKNGRSFKFYGVWWDSGLGTEALRTAGLWGSTSCFTMVARVWAWSSFAMWQTQKPRTRSCITACKSFILLTSQNRICASPAQIAETVKTSRLEHETRVTLNPNSAKPFLAKSGTVRCNLPLTLNFRDF